MICPKCGHEEKGNFCSNCGALLIRYRETEDTCTESVPEEKVRAESRRAQSSQADASFHSRAKERSKPQKRSRKSEKKADSAKAKADQKIRRRLEQRLGALEKERDRERLLKEKEEKQSRRERCRPLSDPGEVQASAADSEKKMLGVIVLLSRAMQLCCFLLMGSMVWVSARTFWYGRTELGSIRCLVSEENYGLALYLGAAGITLFFGVIWCLWILSRKAAGGGVRMHKYDTGRGLIPFLLCLAAVYAAVPAASFVPGNPEAFRGLAGGAAAVLEAVNANHEFLAFASTAGAVLSLIRRLLRV